MDRELCVSNRSSEQDPFFGENPDNTVEEIRGKQRWKTHFKEGKNRPLLRIPSFYFYK